MKKPNEEAVCIVNSCGQAAQLFTWDFGYPARGGLVSLAKGLKCPHPSGTDPEGNLRQQLYLMMER